MKSVQQQQQLLLPPTQDENILFNNLCLLGLTPQVAAKHGVEINRLMFRKPNTKAMELILYWLYGVCKGRSTAKKELKNIWPIIDHKLQKEFHQKIQDWFRELKQSGDLEIMANSTISALRNAQGVRLVSLLSELSYLALHQQHMALFEEDALQFNPKALSDKDARALLPLERAMLVMAEQGVMELYHRFIADMQAANALQRESEELVCALLNCYYERAAYIRKLQATQPPPSPPEVLSTRESKLRLASQLWRSLEQQLPMFPDIMELLKGVTGSATHPNAIDGMALMELTMESETNRPNLARTQSRPADTDICIVLEVWFNQLEHLGTLVKELAGMGPDGSQISPLATGAGADSHMRDLMGSLSLHRMNLTHLQELKARLTSDLARAEAEGERLKAGVQHAVAKAPKPAPSEDGIIPVDSLLTSSQPSLPPVPRTPMPNPTAMRKTFPFMTYSAIGGAPSTLDTILEPPRSASLTAATAGRPPQDQPPPVPATSAAAVSLPQPPASTSDFLPPPTSTSSPVSPQAGPPASSSLNAITPSDARRLDFSSMEMASPDLPAQGEAAAATATTTTSLLPADSPSPPPPTSPGPLPTPNPSNLPDHPEFNSHLLNSADSPMLWLLTDTMVTADIGDSIDVSLHQIATRQTPDSLSASGRSSSGGMQAAFGAGVNRSGSSQRGVNQAVWGSSPTQAGPSRIAQPGMNANGASQGVVSRSAASPSGADRGGGNHASVSRIPSGAGDRSAVAERLDRNAASDASRSGVPPAAPHPLRVGHDALGTYDILASLELLNIGRDGYLTTGRGSASLSPPLGLPPMDENFDMMESSPSASFTSAGGLGAFAELTGSTGVSGSVTLTGSLGLPPKADADNKVAPSELHGTHMDVDSPRAGMAGGSGALPATGGEKVNNGKLDVVRMGSGTFDSSKIESSSKFEVESKLEGPTTGGKSGAVTSGLTPPLANTPPAGPSVEPAWTDLLETESSNEESHHNHSLSLSIDAGTAADRNTATSKSTAENWVLSYPPSTNPSVPFSSTAGLTIDADKALSGLTDSLTFASRASSGSLEGFKQLAAGQELTSGQGAGAVGGGSEGGGSVNELELLRQRFKNVKQKKADVSRVVNDSLK